MKRRLITGSGITRDLSKKTFHSHLKNLSNGRVMAKTSEMAVTPELSLADFAMGRRLGAGAFGEVHVARRKRDGKDLVIKRIAILGCSRREQFDALNEVKLMASLEHPHVVTYLGSFVEAQKLHIVMEHCAGGDLKRLIDARNGVHLPEREAWQYLLQASAGVSYLHACRVLHRDLKSSNLFLKNGVLKIGDLGVSKLLDSSTQLATTMVGTPYYLSPELCENARYDAKSDIWALGVVGYELLALAYPFTANNQAALILRILRGGYAPLPENRYSVGLRGVVDACLQPQPALRPTAAQILELPAAKRHRTAVLSHLAAPITQHPSPTTLPTAQAPAVATAAEAPAPAPPRPSAAMAAPTSLSAARSLDECGGIDEDFGKDDAALTGRFPGRFPSWPPAASAAVAQAVAVADVEADDGSLSSTEFTPRSHGSLSSTEYGSESGEDDLPERVEGPSAAIHSRNANDEEDEDHRRMIAFMAAAVNGPKGDARSPGRSPAARPSPAGRAAAYAVKELARKELRRAGAPPRHVHELEPELDAPGAKEFVGVPKDLMTRAISRQALGTAHAMAALGGASRQLEPVGAQKGGSGGHGAGCTRAAAPQNKVGGTRVEAAAGSAPAGAVVSASVVRSPPGAVASAGAVAVASAGAVVGSGARYAAAAAAVSGNRNRVRGRFNGPPDVGLSAARLGIHDALRKAEERRQREEERRAAASAAAAAAEAARLASEEASREAVLRSRQLRAEHSARVQAAMAEQASAASAAAARRGGARPPTAARPGLSSRPGLSRLHALESEASRRQPQDETDEAHRRQPELCEDEATGLAGMAEADATGAPVGQSAVSGRPPPPPVTTPVTIRPSSAVASARPFAASSPWLPLPADETDETDEAHRLPLPGIINEEDEYEEDGDGGVEDDEEDGGVEDEKLDLNEAEEAMMGGAVLLDVDAEDEPQDDDDVQEQEMMRG